MLETSRETSQPSLSVVCLPGSERQIRCTDYLVRLHNSTLGKSEKETLARRLYENHESSSGPFVMQPTLQPLKPHS